MSVWLIKSTPPETRYIKFSEVEILYRGFNPKVFPRNTALAVGPWEWRTQTQCDSVSLVKIWYWCYLIRIPISIPLQPRRYLVPFPMHYQLMLFPKTLKRSHGPEHIPFGDMLIYHVDLHTKFKVPSFTHFMHTIGAQKFNKKLRGLYPLKSCQLLHSCTKKSHLRGLQLEMTLKAWRWIKLIEIASIR